MRTTSEHIARLILKEISNTLNEDERALLDQWKNASADNKAQYRRLTNMRYLIHELAIYEDAESVADKLIAPVPEKEALPIIAPHRIHFLRRRFLKYAAAIILITGGCIYLYTLNTVKKETITGNIETIPADLLPGSNKAILTLSDGTNITLDSTASETITDGSLSINNKNGQLVYESKGLSIPSLSAEALSPSHSFGDRGAKEAGGMQSGLGAREILYNIMSTPRGGQYQLTLSDGTRVWLNAASSITYPTVFTSETRTVSITGEVYFEVKSNKQQPFIVRAGRTQEITVLGTSFNINAYPDEPFTKTSLLEGSVKIDRSILKPGEAYQNGNIIKTDLTQDMAWKNGIFNFHGKNVEQVMRQLSRWYNVDVSYESTPPTTIFYGEMGKNLTLSKVLEFLEKSGIKFRLEKGNKLKVLR